MKDPSQRMDLLKVARPVTNPSPLPADCLDHHYEYRHRHKWHQPAMSSNSKHSWSISAKHLMKKEPCGTPRGWIYMRELQSLNGPYVVTNPSPPAKYPRLSAVVTVDLRVITAFGASSAKMGQLTQAGLQQGTNSGVDRNLMSNLRAHSPIPRLNSQSLEIGIDCPALPKTPRVAVRTLRTCNWVFVSPVCPAQS